MITFVIMELQPIENTETHEIETTYSKGRELEEAFALFMKRELGWAKMRVGAHLYGSTNRKGASVDIIGERVDRRGKIFVIGAIGIFIISIVFVMCYVLNFSQISLNVSLGAFWLFLIISGVYYYIGVTHNKENALVECKNLKTKVNINQIEKTIRELREYRESKDNEYKFEYHYFVSANGYIENALKCAIEHNIICYERTGESFKRVGYWQ